MGGKKALESATGGKFELVSSRRDITQCFEIPVIDPSDLIGYTFVRKHDETA